MITVYDSPTCGPCFALKRALDRAGVPYETRDAASVPEEILQAWRAKGWSTPVVEYEGGSFSGFLPAKVQTLIDMRR